MLKLAPGRLGRRLLALARGSFSGAVSDDGAKLRGDWVALDRCRYDEGSEQPTSGRIVDSDADLGDLCTRLRNASQGRCVIVRADDGYEVDSTASDPTLFRTKRPVPSAA